MVHNSTSLSLGRPKPFMFHRAAYAMYGVLLLRMSPLGQSKPTSQSGWRADLINTLDKDHNGFITRHELADGASGRFVLSAHP